MANAVEQNQFDTAVRLIEPGDSVVGGAGAPINQPLQALANRTLWLKNQTDTLRTATAGKADATTAVKAGSGLTGGGSLAQNCTIALGAPGQITAQSQNAVQETGHTHAIDTATTSRAGIVMLDNGTGSEAEDRAATPKAVKTAYDNSIRRGGAVGLGGQNHQIAIGWDTAGLVARVDNNVMNVGVNVGAVAYFAQDIPPFGWLKANGAEVSRTVYANLFAAIGERYGRGDGRTTFNLPDLRGEFIRSWDDGRAIDRNRALGSWQEDEFRSHSHGIGVKRMSDTDRGSSSSTVSVDTVGQTDPAGGIETRPRNIALLACIKA